MPEKNLIAEVQPSALPDEHELLDVYQRLRVKIRQQTENPPKWTGGRSLQPYVEYLVLLPDLFHLAVKLMFDSRVAWQRKLVLAAAIAYLLNPLDLMLDMIPVVGQIDDLLVLAKALNYFFNADDEQIQRAIHEHWAGDALQLQQAQELLALVEQAITDMPAAIRRLLQKLPA